LRDDRSFHAVFSEVFPHVFCIQEAEEQKQRGFQAVKAILLADIHKSLPVLISFLMAISPSEMSLSRIKIKQMEEHLSSLMWLFLMIK